MKIPFYIIHVDLWDPGIALSNNLAGRHLLNTMCDLTKFVVSTITIDTHAEHLVKLFMDNYLLSSGMVEIIVVNSDSWPLVRGNKNAWELKSITDFSKNTVNRRSIHRHT